MKSKKQDAKLVSKQDHELEYICGTWYDSKMNHLPMKVLKDVVNKVGRSRIRIYSVLKYLNYHFDPRKASKKK